MVTQQEAAAGYLKMQSELSEIHTAIRNLENIIEIKLGEIKSDISRSRTVSDQCKTEQNKRWTEINERLIVQEQFSSKVIYFYSAVTLLLGIIIGRLIL